MSDQAPLDPVKEGNIVQHNERKEEIQVKVRERKEREAAAKRREVRLQAAYIEQLSLTKEG